MLMSLNVLWLLITVFKGNYTLFGFYRLVGRLRTPGRLTRGLFQGVFRGWICEAFVLFRAVELFIRTTDPPQTRGAL